MTSNAQTDRAPDVSAAVIPIRSRALRDFKQLIRAHRFSVMAAVIAAIAAGIGALAPSDASGGERFAFAALAALGAPLATYALALLWSILRAPFRQRKELIAHLASLQAASHPQMAMIPAVERRESTYEFGSPRFCSLVFVRIYNAQEQGGPEATVRNITPEVKVFAPGDQLVFHHKGWEQMAARDFTIGQEEQALWIASKWEHKEGFSLIRGPDAPAVKALSDGSYSVVVTLRGFLSNGPISKRFVLTSRGVDSGLTFEEELSK